MPEIGTRTSPITLDEEQQQQDEAAFSQEMTKARRTWEPAGFRPFGKDIMIMDPATVHHDEAVDKLARKLDLPQRPGSRRNSRRALCRAKTRR